MVRRGGWGAAMWGRREVGCGGRGRNNRGLGGAVIFSLTAGRDPEEERDRIAHSRITYGLRTSAQPLRRNLLHFSRSSGNNPAAVVVSLLAACLLLLLAGSSSPPPPAAAASSASRLDRSKMKITWGKNAKTNRQPSVAPSKPGLPFGVDSDNDETEKEETRVVTTDCPGTKPSDNAESLKNQGNRLAEEGKYHEALGKWEAALTLMPNNAILHEQKAQILLELGDAWRALTAATRATELDPLWPEVSRHPQGRNTTPGGWVTLGRAQLNFGEPDSAILSFDKALAIEPDNNEAKSDRETAARLVKKRGQLHSSGLSANKRRFTVGEDSEKEKDDSQMEDVEKCKEDEEKERDDSQLENLENYEYEKVDSIRTFLLQDSTSPEGESVRRMWRKGNKRFGGGGEPAAKRRAAGDDGPSESADDDIVVAQISKNRRVAVRTWNGKVVVDIREFYEKDGKTLPGRKGIQLPMDQWKILRDNIKAIDEAIKENA
uniref:Transcriptional coactivator p15 (PC4) C-terminal domain-containing protein n=1 Tax=Oryza nivara TaxID=4536 RepID=A0A0E0G843_ORYNI